jgi:hypothetical protein
MVLLRDPTRAVPLCLWHQGQSRVTWLWLLCSLRSSRCHSLGADTLVSARQCYQLPHYNFSVLPCLQELFHPLLSTWCDYRITTHYSLLTPTTTASGNISFPWVSVLSRSRFTQRSHHRVPNRSVLQSPPPRYRRPWVRAAVVYLAISRPLWR